MTNKAKRKSTKATARDPIREAALCEAMVKLADKIFVWKPRKARKK